MKSKEKNLLVACAITLVLSGAVLGQESVALSVAPSALRALEIGGIAEGQQVKVEGIVINRNEESFTVRDSKGTETLTVNSANGRDPVTGESSVNLPLEAVESVQVDLISCTSPRKSLIRDSKEITKPIVFVQRVTLKDCRQVKLAAQSAQHYERTHENEYNFR